mmetsp:Transcript_15850/g.40159  ORF Transcript_15850/g.40159 Transcript_15850/m.40159 type:complete len:742 (-) Transcript_15850:979-3204(-)
MSDRKVGGSEGHVLRVLVQIEALERDGGSKLAIDNAVEEIRDLCFHYGMPPSLRTSVWKRLLGATPSTALKGEDLIKEYQRGKFALSNQRVVKADAKRTRRDIDGFDTDTRREEIECLLSFYCTKHACNYKQGMNELLAPFFAVEPRTELPEILDLFEGLQRAFLPTMFTTDNFEQLTANLSLFRLLLRYHDPQLAHVLEQFDVDSSMYATRWFITLFSQGTKMELLVKLWDLLFLLGDPFFVHFLGVALMVDNKKKILKADRATAPAVVASLGFCSDEDVQRLWDSGRRLQRETPRIFKELLFSSTFGGNLDALSDRFLKNDDVKALPIANALRRKISRLQQMDEWECIPVPGSYLVAQCYGFLRGEDEVRFFILDVRSEVDFQRGHLPGSINLPAADWESGDALPQLLEKLSALRGLHVCLLGYEADGDAPSSSSKAEAGVHGGRNSIAGAGGYTSLASKLLGWARSEGDASAERKGDENEGGGRKRFSKSKRSTGTERPVPRDPWQGGKTMGTVWIAMQILYQHGYNHLTFTPDSMSDIEELVWGVGEMLVCIEPSDLQRQGGTPAASSTSADTRGTNYAAASSRPSTPTIGVSAAEKIGVGDALFEQGAIAAFPLLVRKQGAEREEKACIVLEDSPVGIVQKPGTLPLPPLSLRFFDPLSNAGQRRRSRKMSNDFHVSLLASLPSPVDILRQANELYEGLCVDGEVLEFACGDTAIRLRVQVLISMRKMIQALRYQI